MAPCIERRQTVYGNRMGASGTVAHVARQRWGIRLGPLSGRFAEPGWSYEERVGFACPTCRGALHTLRKPYVTGGRQQRYVSVVCPTCPGHFTLQDLGLTTYAQLKQAPAAVRRPAAAPPPPPPKATPGPQSSRGAGIVRFGRWVALFGAQAGAPPDPARNRFEVRAGDRLPWQPGHRLARRQLKPSQVWRHTVYGGVFPLDRLHRTLEGVFGPSGPDVDERTPRGDSALFAVNVSADGEVLLDSLVVSTAAWAVGRAVDPGPAEADWLDGFTATAGALLVASQELLVDANQRHR